MQLLNVQLELANALTTNEECLGLQFHENMQIYRHSSQYAMQRALYTTYPLIRKLVGDDFFVMLMKDYIVKYPSRSPYLQEYGVYFGDYVAIHPALKNLVYLSEVAKFEWAYHQLINAADAAFAPLHVLQNIPEEKYPMLRIVLNPASALIKFYYPILDIIELCEGSVKEVDISGGRVNLLMIRREGEIKLQALSDAEFTFLHALQENETLAASLHAAKVYDAHFDVAKRLPNWVKDKTLVSFVW